MNVPETPAPTLGLVQGLAGNPVHVQPAGAVMETKEVFAGVASENVPLVAAVEPVFVTTCVYVMLFPAWTGFGEAEFVTERLGPAPPTIAVTLAVLFAELGSVAADETDAVSVRAVPFATPVLTLTTRVNVAEVDPAIFTLVQTTLPVPPSPGVRQLHPAGDAIETNVVFAGTVETRVALSAALGPPLVTICV